MHSKQPLCRAVPVVVAAVALALMTTWMTTLTPPSKAQPSATQPNPSETQPNRLVVHEWGTFTSISNEGGLALEWRPLQGASDLPSFVYTPSDLFEYRSASGEPCTPPGKDCTQGRIRMETPVIYFYADQPTTASVTVRFPNGSITEWFPDAARPGDLSEIHWRDVRILPTARPWLPTEASPSHYYPARETDAATVEMNGVRGREVERFLFYRGVGMVEPVVTVGVSGDRIHLVNRGEHPIEDAIVLERRNTALRFQVMDLATGSVSGPRPTQVGEVEDVEELLRTRLLARGLYPKEVEAMLATWRESWFEEGLRAFYLLPDEGIENMLPLSVTPEPTERVRVIVGRAEAVTPELRQRVQSYLESLSCNDPPTLGLATALDALGPTHRFARAVLEDMGDRTTDPALREKIYRILNGTYHCILSGP